MSSVATDVRKTRQVALPVRGGEISLEVPEELSDPTLYKEIATQDIGRGRLLGFINKLQRISGSNRELLLCSELKLQAITREFLKVCSGLRRFVADLSTFHSTLNELEEAREDVKAFFYGNISGTIDEIADFQKIVFAPHAGEVSSRRQELAASGGENDPDERRDAILAAFGTHRYPEIAGGVRSIDQILIDLEGTLLQWEKGIARRAFAQEE